jgi:hypothetical protein
MFSVSLWEELVILWILVPLVFLQTQLSCELKKNYDV